MHKNLTRKIIEEHLVAGSLTPGEEIQIKIDQTLTQDATGTMAYLQWEALDLPRVKTELSVSYVDHNTLQMGFKNPDDHRYLRTVAARYGIVFSPPGTGICHQLHLENFAVPGKTLIGSDSHTPTAGGVGSLAMGAGGLSVALAMAGEPYSLYMPRVVKVYLEGKLTGHAGAKDIILHILQRLSVKGGTGRVLEYTGPGVADLSVPERATITNMGAELGATTSIFPADETARRFLRSMQREGDFSELGPDPEASYDQELFVDLSSIEPMAARPHMPDLGTTVRELEGRKVDQVAIGSCTNSSYADLKITAKILAGRKVSEDTELLISPGSKQVLKMLAAEGLLEPLLDSGARILECACGPCIGMGGSPVSGGVSARTFNRNFEGRSGTQDAGVYLVSPVTAAHTALEGAFTSPEKWGEPQPRPSLPDNVPSIRDQFIFPEDADSREIYRGPNIVPLPQFEPLPQNLDLPVLIKCGDNISTDHILPGGAQVTALRSNIPAISEYIFSRLDEDFVPRAMQAGQGLILGGENYGQGSSREHAALAPRYLGVRVVLVKSFARIHRANLINFGILPLILTNPQDYDRLEQDQAIRVNTTDLVPGGECFLEAGAGDKIKAVNDLTPAELEIIKYGGLLNLVRERKKGKA
ncbi:aconitate hydratase [Desulfonatronospira thiodismutans ASO3-1]|uniref:Aconitate hydratase A n=1 Tax=Desulfonatronospira thiodismutans ASO3-1 TaxID=555779 RepID=D6SRD5_9BACT|nr:MULTISPECIES: aconitate hydratase [Desulfonatronospira]EFI33251.1 aconitate hydratase [Desulfonatronospira thiodismutans ASO3-1]RQD76159.1 MAG: aconitate hydratase [Desulfonatronospira sp. MSAO_Bac3]